MLRRRACDGGGFGYHGGAFFFGHWHVIYCH